MRLGDTEIRPVGGRVGCLGMLAFSLAVSLLLTLMLNLLLR